MDRRPDICDRACRSSRRCYSQCSSVSPRSRRPHLARPRRLAILKDIHPLLISSFPDGVDVPCPRCAQLASLAVSALMLGACESRPPAADTTAVADPAAAAATAAADSSLYSRLGGKDAITAVIEDLDRKSVV